MVFLWFSYGLMVVFSQFYASCPTHPGTSIALDEAPRVKIAAGTAVPRSLPDPLFEVLPVVNQGPKIWVCVYIYIHTIYTTLVVYLPL